MNYSSTNGTDTRPSPNDLFTVLEVAAYLKRSRKTAYELVRSGAIKSVRLSERGIRVTRKALETYVGNKQVETTRPLLDRAKLQRAGRIR